jgi:poly(3-hydroxybutyrate) depolymerase
MVSVSGISAGGAMAASLACLYPELMGSVALVGAPMPYADRSSDEALEEMRCGPSAGVKTAAQQAMRAAKQHAQAPECLPVLVVHGLKDTVVHAQHAMGHEQAFLGLNEALGSAQGPAIPVQKDSKQAMARLWRNSKGSVIGALLAPSDLGHAWSGGNPSEPFSQEGFDQSRLIIDFFEAARSRNWNLFEPEVLTSRLVAEKKIASFKRKAFKSGP